MEGELNEEYEYVSTSVQMLNIFWRGTTEMGFDTMDLADDLPPQDLTENVF